MTAKLLKHCPSLSDIHRSLGCNQFCGSCSLRHSIIAASCIVAAIAQAIVAVIVVIVEMIIADSFVMIKIVDRHIS